MISIKPSIEVESGTPGNSHNYYLSDNLSFDDFDGCQDRMVKSHNSDPNAAERSRVLRLPGFFHCKREPVMTRLVGGTGRRYSRDEILTAFPPIARPEYTARAIKGDLLYSAATEALVRSWVAAIPGQTETPRVVWVKHGFMFARLGDSWAEGTDDIRLEMWETLWEKFERRTPDEVTCAKKWEEILYYAAQPHERHVTWASIWHMAKEADWSWETSGLSPEHIEAAKAALAKALEKPRTSPEDAFDAVEIDDDERRGVTLKDFYCYLPQPDHFIFIRTGDRWPATSVNSQILPVELIDSKEEPKLIEKGAKKGEPETMLPSTWIARNRPVQTITWAPGEPQVIKGRLSSAKGWTENPGMTCYNTYRPAARLRGGAANKAGVWLDLVHKVYPNDWEHIIKWYAHRVQRPGEKINHALLKGGKQGIGKDLMARPLEHAIGAWNFQETSPRSLMKDYNPYLKAVVLRVNEAHDLGDVGRFTLYELMKTCTTSPPDMLPINEKYLEAYYITNVVGIIITSHKTEGTYLPADDRRHYVAWSDLTKDDFTEKYWRDLDYWYEHGGYEHVAAYLTQLDISGFDPKAPPPKTDAFHQIVAVGLSPESTELGDVLDEMGRPDATTIGKIIEASGIGGVMAPHRLGDCGYVTVHNPDRPKDGFWKIGGVRQMVYGKASLSIAERLKAAQRLVAEAN